MAEQTFKNHTRIDPIFSFVVIPVLLINLILQIKQLMHNGNAGRAWQVVVALALLLLAAQVRRYSLRVQDRVIRLEERIRMAALMPLESRALQAGLTTEQIVALRFASDPELATLAERAVEQKLSPKAIKQQIVTWRPDTHRV